MNYDTRTPYYIPERKPSLWQRLRQCIRFWRTTSRALPKLFKFKNGRIQ